MAVLADASPRHTLCMLGRRKSAPLLRSLLSAAAAPAAAAELFGPPLTIKVPLMKPMAMSSKDSFSKAKLSVGVGRSSTMRVAACGGDSDSIGGGLLETINSAADGTRTGDPFSASPSLVAFAALSLSLSSSRTEVLAASLLAVDLKEFPKRLTWNDCCVCGMRQTRAQKGGVSPNAEAIDYSSDEYSSDADQINAQTTAEGGGAAVKKAVSPPEAPLPKPHRSAVEALLGAALAKAASEVCCQHAPGGDAGGTRQRPRRGEPQRHGRQQHPQR